MKGVFIGTILGFLMFTSSVLAASSYTEYDGSGQFSIEANIANMADEASGDAESYSGVQYLTNTIHECGDYDICAFDEAEATNGLLDLQQTVVNDFDDNSYQTIYNTGLDGTGLAHSMVFSDSTTGYSYQEAIAEGDTHAYFTQSHYIDSDFDYMASYGGGTQDCDDGSVYLENGYELGSYPAVYTPPIALEPNCQGTGCNYVELYGESTDTLYSEASIETPGMTWFSLIDAIGISMFNVFGSSGFPINFDFIMVLE